MKINASAVAALLIPLLCGAQPRGPVISPLRPVVPATLARTAEFAFQVDGDYANPFDPDQIRVDATVTGPTGQVWQVPAFWLEPWAMGTSPSATRFAGLTFLQFFLDANLFPRDKPVSFAITDVALVDSASGLRRAFPELADPAAWTARTGATVAAGTTPQGEPMLVVTIIPYGQGYPGIHLVPHGDLADWSAYDTLHFRAMPLAGLKGLPLSLEVRKDKTKRSFPVFKAGGREQNWQDCVWRYDRRTPAVTWTPAGKGEWRLRLAVPTAGDYRIALTATDRAGTTSIPPQAFPLAQSSEHGFIRVAPECPRYLRYDSGEPFFSVGSNLLVFTDDFAEYVYYIDRFAGVGANLFRVWLDIPRLGFEKQALGQYDPKACAVLDALLNHADQRDAALMLCLLDFREVSAKANNPMGGWDRNPYNTVCATPAEFFTGAAAKNAFRKRLRYLVARWSASPAVHSWEFFNEVNITDAWRQPQGTDQVRAWHAVMATALRQLDPYGHILTTSLSTSADDPIWGEPWLELVQPHCYQTAALDFASFLRPPCLELAHHGKPVLPGEFGLMTIKYEDVVEGGVSIHNGMWASAMSGCAGAAMPWWWDWIDRHDYYGQFRGIAGFVKDVRWHEQAFLPIPDPELAVAVPQVAGAALGPALLKLERHTWDATAPYNQPARIEVRRDGSMTPAGALSTRLHGLRNHRDCHNPKTFLVDWPGPGRFVVSVGDVSGYGGANLRIFVDDEEKLFQDFVDEDEQLKGVISAYRGDYAVDVPAGQHEIRIENTGTDWLTLNQIRLDHYTPPQYRIQAMGLRGRDTVLLWLRNQDYTWFGTMTEQPCEPIGGAQLLIQGMPPGNHTIQFYDPQTATWLESHQQPAQDGKLKLDLPAIPRDLALVIRRETGK